MLDNILGLIKDTVSKNVLNNSIVPDDKKAQTVETTTQAMAEGLKQHLTPGNIGSLMGLFGNGNSGAITANPVISDIQSTVTNSLVQKVGLSQSIASAISAAVVPMVMNAISGKVNDPNEKGFNIESLVHAFTGKSGENQESGTGSSILSGLGKLFGNK